MASADLPEVISRYQDAHDRHDTEVALSAFTTDARVLDDGRAHEGSEGVRTFLAKAASEFTFTRSLLSATELEPGRWMVVNHLEGDFPGGVVDLRYQFAITHGLISELVITP